MHEGLKQETPHVHRCPKLSWTCTGPSREGVRGSVVELTFSALQLDRTNTFSFLAFAARVPYGRKCTCGEWKQSQELTNIVSVCVYHSCCRWVFWYSALGSPCPRFSQLRKARAGLNATEEASAIEGSAAKCSRGYEPSMAVCVMCRFCGLKRASERVCRLF